MTQKRQNYKRIQSNNSYSSAYISGSTVKKLNIQQPVEKEVFNPDVERRERNERRRAQAQINRANKLNFLYTVGVTAVIAVIFGICFQYLNLQTSVKNNAAEISQLESEYNSLKSANDEEEAEIKASINMDNIYNTAVNDLGMVYPNKEQVVQYQSGESEYVRQYKDIPQAN